MNIGYNIHIMMYHQILIFEKQYDHVMHSCFSMIGCISLEKYSFTKGGRGRRFFLASLLFGVHSTVSLTALHGMNIPMYSAIKVQNKARFKCVHIKKLYILATMLWFLKHI